MNLENSLYFVSEDNHFVFRCHPFPRTLPILKKKQKKLANVICVRHISLELHEKFINSIFLVFFLILDGDYSKGITFYKLAIDKLRRYCQTLSNPIEKKRGTEVSTFTLDCI